MGRILIFSLTIVGVVFLEANPFIIRDPTGDYTQVQEQLDQINCRSGA